MDWEQQMLRQIDAAAKPGSIAEGGEVPISRLRLMTEAERHRVLVAWNGTAVAYPREKCVHELFEEQVERTPEAVAVVFEDKRLTYRQLNERANRLAHHLRKLGVGREVLVGIALERSLEMMIALLGVLKAGGAYFALEENLPADRIRLLLADARPRVLLARRSAGDDRIARLGEILKDLAGGAIQLAVVEDLVAGAVPDGVAAASGGYAGEAAYLSYTSGSTGRPKGVLVSHRGVVRLVKGADYVSLSEREVLLHLSPLAFDASTFEIWGGLLNGGRVVLMPPGPPTPGDIGQTIREHGVTTLWLTAGLFHLMVDEKLEDLKPLRQLLAGGDVLSPEHVGKARRRLGGCRIINGYGPTENTTFTCCHTVTAEEDLTPGVPIGRPIANTRVYVLDANLEPVPVGVAGELYVGGDGVAIGYLNQPELTAERFIADPFSRVLGARLYRTGDYVRWRNDGNLMFLGRQDDQIKIRGFRIELGEIEAQLRQQVGVREAVVLVREDQGGEKRLVAYLTASGGELPPASVLREQLAAKLPGYMIPSGYVRLEALPLTPNGKVDRKALRGPGLESSTADFSPSQTPTEVALTKIVSDLLGLEAVGVHANFFEIGGHSLFAMRLVSRIKRDLNCSLTLRTVFQYPTIQKLAVQVSHQPAIRRKSELIQVQKGGSGPDLIFLVDEGSLGLFKLAYLLDQDFPLYISVSHLPMAALKASAQKRLDDLPSMADLASAHVELIKNRNSQRPIILVGHCFGGELATEVAVQLTKSGEKVEAVFMLDTWMTSPGFWWGKKTWIQAHFQKFIQLGPAYFLHKSRRRIKIEKEELSRQINLTVDGSDDVVVPWSVIERIYVRAKAIEVWKRPLLECRGLLFVSKDDWQSNAYRKIDNTLGTNPWFVNKVEVVDVPGDHVTVLDEKHLPELAQCVNDALKKIRGFNS